MLLILIFPPLLKIILRSRKYKNCIFFQLEIKLILEMLEFSTELKFRVQMLLKQGVVT